MRGFSSEKWKARQWVFLDKHLRDYDFVKDYTLIYFYANNIHNATLTYKRAGDKDLNKFLNYVGKPKDKLHPLEGKLKIAHDPTRLNYWHVENLTIDHEGKVFTKNKSAWAEDFGKTVIEHVLCVNAYDNIENIEHIPEKYFVS